MVLEKTLESPLDCKEVQPVHLKGDQSWVFIGRTDAETETPVLGQLMQRADSLEKTLMLGRIGGRRRTGRQGEMVGWPHQLSGRECEQTLGNSGGQRSLACCRQWGCKDSDTT